MGNYYERLNFNKMESVVIVNMPFITAHSGCMQTPLNSIQGVIEGLSAGADIIEVDIRATKDGVVVLLHDECIAAPSGHPRIQDLTFDELKAVADPEDIVRLEEVLPIIRDHGRVANLDVKEDHAISFMIRAVERYNMRNQVIISGCERERALYLKDNYRAYQVLLNASAKLYKVLEEDYASFVTQTCEDAVAASCCGVNINYLLCRRELVDYAARRCLPVLVWTLDSAEVMKQFLDMPVHSITSNEVPLLSLLRKDSMGGRIGGGRFDRDILV
jgi:glycerophosphoryl diester phosphodiesterase